MFHRLTRALGLLWGKRGVQDLPAGSASGDLLPPVPNVRELPREELVRWHREVAPNVSVYWHDGVREWHVVERVPGRPSQEAGRQQLGDYRRMWTDEGLYAHPFKWRQALYQADGWRLLLSVDRWELCEADKRMARYLLTVPESVLRAALRQVREAAEMDAGREEETSARLREALSDPYVYRRAFRGRVFQRPASPASLTRIA